MNIDQSRVFLLGMLFKCPFDRCLKTCIVNDIRDKYKTPHAIFDYANTASDIEVIDLIEKHKQCLYKREHHENNTTFGI